jgi:hypothetical protein
MFNPAKAVAV